jgi:CheY-like chemotaxis protein
LLDVLVLDETEVARDLVALAVEGQGHLVRCAGSYAEFIRHLDERLPDLIVTEIELSKAPARKFSRGLVELLATRPVPLVFFSAVPGPLLQELAGEAHARAAVSKDDGVAALMAALERVVGSL